MLSPKNARVRFRGEGEVFSFSSVIESRAGRVSQRGPFVHSAEPDCRKGRVYSES